jgi:hypothetical protein
VAFGDSITQYAFEPQAMGWLAQVSACVIRDCKMDAPPLT